MNLISNAYKFTPEGGKVSVVLKECSASEPGYYDAVLMDIQMPVMNGHISKPLEQNSIKRVLKQIFECEIS